jgi:ketosteroid isomerase-like protein
MLWENVAQEVYSMKKLLMFAGVLMLLGACSAGNQEADNENSAADSDLSNENNAIDHGIEDKSVGFTMEDDGNIVEADVPAEEAEKILAAYKEYIDSFNAEDLDRYMAVIADEPAGFDREEDKVALAQAFETYDTTYRTSDETIVKYEQDRAEVFASVEVEMAETGTSRNVTQTGRQVVVFVNEDGNWKLTSLHFIGNQ